MASHNQNPSIQDPTLRSPARTTWAASSGQTHAVTYDGVNQVAASYQVPNQVSRQRTPSHLSQYATAATTHPESIQAGLVTEDARSSSRKRLGADANLTPREGHTGSIRRTVRRPSTRRTLYERLVAESRDVYPRGEELQGGISIAEVSRLLCNISFEGYQYLMNNTRSFMGGGDAIHSLMDGILDRLMHEDYWENGIPDLRQNNTRENAQTATFHALIQVLQGESRLPAFQGRDRTPAWLKVQQCLALKAGIGYDRTRCQIGRWLDPSNPRSLMKVPPYAWQFQFLWQVQTSSCEEFRRLMKHYPSFDFRVWPEPEDRSFWKNINDLAMHAVDEEFDVPLPDERVPPPLPPDTDEETESGVPQQDPIDLSRLDEDDDHDQKIARGLWRIGWDTARTLNEIMVSKGGNAVIDYGRYNADRVKGPDRTYNFSVIQADLREIRDAHPTAALRDGFETLVVLILDTKEAELADLQEEQEG